MNPLDTFHAMLSGRPGDDLWSKSLSTAESFIKLGPCFVARSQLSSFISGIACSELLLFHCC